MMIIFQMMMMIMIMMVLMMMMMVMMMMTMKIMTVMAMMTMMPMMTMMVMAMAMAMVMVMMMTMMMMMAMAMAMVMMMMLMMTRPTVIAKLLQSQSHTPRLGGWQVVRKCQREPQCVEPRGGSHGRARAVCDHLGCQLRLRPPRAASHTGSPSCMLTVRTVPMRRVRGGAAVAAGACVAAHEDQGSECLLSAPGDTHA